MTCSVVFPSDADIVLYHDMPKKLPEHADKSYLLILESAAIRPHDFNPTSYSSFKKAFTWSDDLIYNNKFHIVQTFLNSKLITPFEINSSAKIVVNETLF